MFRLPIKKPSVSKEIYKCRCLLDQLCKQRFARIFLIGSALLFLLPFILIFSLKPKPQENVTFGITFSNKYATELGLDWKQVYLAILDDLHIKNMRLVAYWDEIEAEKGVYNFDNIKWQMDEAQKRGVNVILTIGRKVPRYPECFEPRWWQDTYDPQIRDEELYKYIKTIINEFKAYDSIKMWQVENEPFFPFGLCSEIKKSTVLKEIEIVKSLDPRPILVQDSGEGGLWKETYAIGDYLGISMYRKVWFRFLSDYYARFTYVEYPIASWLYKVKADVFGVPYQKVIVTELQTEPWGPVINSKLTTEEKNRTMSKRDFLETIVYAQKSGLSVFYLWGTEWWYWEKTINNNPFYWNAAKVLFE